jgi:hypothetical protein
MERVNKRDGIILEKKKAEKSAGKQEEGKRRIVKL